MTADKIAAAAVTPEKLQEAYLLAPASAYTRTLSWAQDTNRTTGVRPRHIVLSADLEVDVGEIASVDLHFNDAGAVGIYGPRLEFPSGALGGRIREVLNLSVFVPPGTSYKWKSGATSGTIYGVTLEELDL